LPAKKEKESRFPKKHPSSFTYPTHNAEGNSSINLFYVFVTKKPPLVKDL